jgi:RNA recognition motif-containing protein
MRKRIYVGNLSNGTTEDQLRSLFGQVGKVDFVRIMRDRTAWPSIVAFVEMSVDDAKKAIAQFNGKELNGRTLTVNDPTDLTSWLWQEKRAA